MKRSRSFHTVLARTSCVAVMAVLLGSGSAASALQRSGDRAQRSADKKARSKEQHTKSSVPTKESQFAVLDELRAAVHQKMELTDKQSETIDRLFAAHREELTTIYREMENPSGGGTTDPQELRRQLLEARKRGDRDKMRELRTQMMGSQSGQTKLRGAVAGFDKQVAGELTDDQRSTYRRLSRDIRSPRNKKADLSRRFSTIIRNLRSVDLTAEQSTSVRAIMKDFRGKLSEFQSDPESVAGVLSNVRGQLLELLTDDQQKEFAAAEAAASEEKKRRDSARDRRKGASKRRDRDK